ncbi:MAG: NUDIX domain-containing protein [Verrucomicrobiota bacterium]
MIQTQKWSHLWGIPGGKIKGGETAEAALRRELREETALEVEDIQFVMVQDCIHSKEFYRDAHFLLLNYTCRCAAPANVKLNEEAQTFRWVTTAEALAMPLNQPTRVLLEEVLRRGQRA